MRTKQLKECSIRGLLNKPKKSYSGVGLGVGVISSIVDGLGEADESISGDGCTS